MHIISRIRDMGLAVAHDEQIPSRENPSGLHAGSFYVAPDLRDWQPHIEAIRLSDTAARMAGILSPETIRQRFSS
ncbi:MAG: hypothetical protein ABIQ57_04875 [Candidatus Kapaibacterium sp.]